jgi:hypothetical protein
MVSAPSSTSGRSTAHHSDEAIWAQIRLGHADFNEGFNGGLVCPRCTQGAENFKGQFSNHRQDREKCRGCSLFGLLHRTDA